MAFGNEVYDSAQLWLHYYSYIGCILSVLDNNGCAMVIQHVVEFQMLECIESVRASSNPCSARGSRAGGAPRGTAPRRG